MKVNFARFHLTSWKKICSLFSDKSTYTLFASNPTEFEHTYAKVAIEIVS